MAKEEAEPPIPSSRPSAHPGAKTLLRLTGYGWRHKWPMLGSLATMALATLAGIAIPTLLGTSVDEALETGLRRNLILAGGAILLVSLIRGVMEYAESYLSESVSQRAAFELRNDFFKKLQHLSFGFHDKHQTGNLMSRATADVEAVRGFLGHGILKWLRIVLMLGTISFLLMSMNWRLGLVCLAFIPIVATRSTTMFFRLKKLWSRRQAEVANMTTVLQENLTGVRVVKAFGAGRHEEKRFQQRASAVAENSYAAASISALRGAQMSLLVGLATVVIVWVGGREVILHNLTTGEMTAFVLYMAMLASPIRGIASAAAGIAQTVAAGQRLFEVLDARSPVRQSKGARDLPKVAGHVKFDNVSLDYDSSKHAVRNISFEAKPGQIVALLGAPGSGKSSLVHMIPRFYDPSSGRITVDDVDTRDVTLESLRKNTGIVLQDVFVFGATIRDNIAYGMRDASLERIEEAAKVAQLHDWVDSLPAGYDTWVGERGITLSGGQRQRLAIARTVLLDPPILILDDSTSSVDVRTEQQIQKALADVIKGRTTFVVAHRMSTLRKADLVLVLDRGRIVESGSHEDLRTLNGIYQRTLKLQLQPQESGTPERRETADQAVRS